mgnify:CR=1 FL=1
MITHVDIGNWFSFLGWRVTDMAAKDSVFFWIEWTWHVLIAICSFILSNFHSNFLITMQKLHSFCQMMLVVSVNHSEQICRNHEVAWPWRTFQRMFHPNQLMVQLTKEWWRRLACWQGMMCCCCNAVVTVFSKKAMMTHWQELFRWHWLLGKIQIFCESEWAGFKECVDQLPVLLPIWWSPWNVKWSSPQRTCFGWLHCVSCFGPWFSTHQISCDDEQTLGLLLWLFLKTKKKDGWECDNAMQLWRADWSNLVSPFSCPSLKQLLECSSCIFFFAIPSRPRSKGEQN